MTPEQMMDVADELRRRSQESLHRVELMMAGPRHRRVKPTARHRKYVMPALARVALAFAAILVPLSAGPRFA